MEKINKKHVSHGLKFWVSSREEILRRGASSVADYLHLAC